MDQMTSIFVLPSEAGQPPRALLMDGDQQIEERITETGAVDGVLAIVIYNNDDGLWKIEGSPVPMELGDTITTHARSLGMDL